MSLSPCLCLSALAVPTLQYDLARDIPADIHQLSLPNTWEAFGVPRGIPPDEEREFF